MLATVRLGRVWDWLTGARPEPKRESPPPPVPDAYVPVPAEPPPVFADARVESMARSMDPADGFLRKAAALPALSPAAAARELVAAEPNDDRKARLAQNSLEWLKANQEPGPWAFGQSLMTGARYSTHKAMIAQLTLASQAAEATGLAGLGLSAMRALDRTYYAQDAAAVGAAALEQLDTPSARLALKLGQAVRYDIHKASIYEAFLAAPESSDPAELASLGYRAAQGLDSNYYAQDRAALERVLIGEVGRDLPALGMAADLAGTVRYDVHKVAIYEKALANPSVPNEPLALLRVGKEMVRSLDTNYYAQDRAAASMALLDKLKGYPETEALADLARMMAGAVRYDVHRVSLADTVFDALSSGQSSELGVAREALGKLDANYYSEDISKVAMAVLQRSDNADARLVLEAMKAVRYDVHRVALSRVVFDHLLAPEPPPFSQLAGRLVGCLDPNYYAQDAVAVGRVLSGRYSNPRARTLLDAALSQQYDSQKAAALKEAFAAIQGIDDDIAEIKNMAKAVSGQGPTSTIVEKKGAVLVGGVRLRVRKEDCESAPQG